MSETGATYEVTNQSSRSFVFGDLTLLPKIPQTINGEQKSAIEQSRYGEFFAFKRLADAPPPQPPTTLQ